MLRYFVLSRRGYPAMLPFHGHNYNSCPHEEWERTEHDKIYLQGRVGSSEGSTNKLRPAILRGGQHRSASMLSVATETSDQCSRVSLEAMAGVDPPFQFSMYLLGM